MNMDAPKTLSKQRLRLWLRLLRAQRLIEADLRDKLRQNFETTLPRFDVMAALERAPEGLRMSELSAQLMVSNGNVTGIVDRLVTDGLVERASVDGDRRAMRVQLTDEGRNGFTRMAEEHEKWVNESLSQIRGGELETLITLLDRIEEEE